MSTGSCPECRNVVAQSAKSCPNCGNRNFVVQTDSFVEICKACDGGGRQYSHSDAKLIEKDCGRCAGNGYVYQAFNVDCRDADEMSRCRNLVRKYQQDEGQVFDAINNQAPNQTFADRGGQLRSETKQTAELHFWSDKTLRASDASNRIREEAVSQFGKSFKTAFTAWFVIGLGGCVARSFSKSLNEPLDIHGDHGAALAAPFKAFLFKGIFAAVIVIAIAGLSAILKIQRANGEKERIGKTMMDKLTLNDK